MTVQEDGSKPARRAEAEMIAETAAYLCGGGHMLAIAPSCDDLVKALLVFGIDARGVNTAQGEGIVAPPSIPGRITRQPFFEFAAGKESVDTLVVSGCLETLTDEELPTVLSTLRQMTKRAILVRVAPEATENSATQEKPRSRIWWETRFFEAGFRKHPLYYRSVYYQGLEHEQERDTITILLEPIPDAALAQYPMEALREERDLHTDMMREPGERSDAHIIRYQWAAELVRSGDTVLDAACGLGYGSYLIQKGTKARRTIGIDGSDYATDYANRNYAACMPGLEFRTGFLPDALAEIEDASIDVVLSFETLEHVEKNTELLAEFHRVLTPGGRIVVSIPNDWTDEDTGKDPNPFHIHVYKLDKLREQLSKHFILEKLTAQSASRHKSGPGRAKWAEATRNLTDVSPDVTEADAPDAEWWLAVGMRSPLEGKSIAFRETQFPTFDDPAWNVTRFDRDYANPWLVRGMVDRGHRLRNEPALAALARETLDTSPANAPDNGAALTVLGYQLLSRGDLVETEVEAYDREVRNLLDATPTTPHGFRWSISLWFVLGQLWKSLGRREKAIGAFQNCVAIDSLLFSPLLANRSIEARLTLGMLVVNDNRPEAAAHWRAGIDLAHRAVTADWVASMGSTADPAEFGLPELASVLEYASSCAYALNALPDFEYRPLWQYEPRRDNISQRAMERAAAARERELAQRVIAEQKGVVERYHRELLAYGRQSVNSLAILAP